MSRVAVIGTGYVGLTTGACLAHLGHTVTCADIDVAKVELLQSGTIPIFEHGLEALVREGLAARRLQFVVGAAEAVTRARAEFVFLCVQTPQGADGSADLRFVEQASADIGPHLGDGAVVITKSTVPVGSAQVVERVLGRRDVAVVSNPEFLREGQAVHDCLHPDRVVIGCDDQAAAAKVAGLYQGLNAPVMVTDPATAETIKYACNAFLATKVSFINAIANLCQAVGADVRDVVLGMGYDKRIGFEFLKPGPGWGGSCLIGAETVLVRRGGATWLTSLENLFVTVDRLGADGWEVLSWRDGDSEAVFLPVLLFTRRPYRGEVVEVRTKMGRRVTVTPDHPFVVGDGLRPSPTGRKLARDLTIEDWLPVAQGVEEPTPLVLVFDLLEDLDGAGIDRASVIARLDGRLRSELLSRISDISSGRARDMLRCGTARLTELDRLGMDASGALVSTVTNGTYVPTELMAGRDFWRIIGLYLAEGHIGADRARRRIVWSFNLVGEEDLAAFVSSFWQRLGVKVTTRRMTTALQVSISSRILAAWLSDGLRLGTNCDQHRIPDAVWDRPAEEKRALLRGLWDGDGSWSLVSGGPSVVLEYGTASRELADGMLRLLADVRVTARLKVGRTPKSTVDTYWISVSGADQVEDALWLLPPDEAVLIRGHLARQQKRIKPTGYRPLAKNVSWVRVIDRTSRPFSGDVYSMEVPGSHTFVATHGLVVSNCFPKDSRALVRIAEDAGYDFELLKGVIAVNEQQFRLLADRIAQLAGGSLEGAVVAVWGLTFKAGTDDLRDSPAISVVERLREHGATVRAYDPTVTDALPPHLRNLDIEVCQDPYAACAGASVLAVLTEWDEFRWLDFEKVAGTMATPVILDARNLLDPTSLRRRGFVYQGLGRK